MTNPSPTTSLELADALRKFRLDAVVAGSRMPWAPDWPLDRLVVEAAVRIEQLEADLVALRAGHQEQWETVKYLHETFTASSFHRRMREMLDAALAPPEARTHIR